MEMLTSQRRYEFVWQCKMIISTELVDVIIVISHCVLLIDSNRLSHFMFMSLKDPIKIESGIEINHSTMEL